MKLPFTIYYNTREAREVVDLTIADIARRCFQPSTYTRGGQQVSSGRPGRREVIGFIVAHAALFVAWVRAVRADPDGTLAKLTEIGAGEIGEARQPDRRGTTIEAGEQPGLTELMSALSAKQGYRPQPLAAQDAAEETDG